MDSTGSTMDRAVRPVVASTTVTNASEASDATSEATRYMAAAMYLDASLCDQALKSLEDDPYRAIGPTYGVDLPVVIEHARRASRLRLGRYALLLVVPLLPFAWEGFWEDVGWVMEQPELIGIFLQYYWGSLLAMLGLSTAIVLGERLYRERLWVGARLSRQRFRHHTSVSGRTRRLLPEEVRHHRPINAVISGGYGPFVGCGGNVGGWSFGIRTDKGREEHGEQRAPRAFEIVELYDAVTAAVRELSIPDLRVEDRLYVDGARISDKPCFLPSRFARPRQHVDDDVVAGMIGKPSESVRHYRCFGVVDWRGEMILTTALRLQRQGSMLFVEANHNLLTPPKREYLAVDSITPWPGPGPLATELARSLLLAPWQSLVAPLMVGSALLAPVRRFFRRRACRRQIRENPSFNYGAVISLRERAASGNYRLHFQQLDKEMNHKLLESRMLDAFIEFLDAHDIDTSSLRERKTTILNNGVLISGGTVKADAIAAGQGARAGLVNLARRLPHAPSVHKDAA
jgi:hypothetical protein